MTIRLTRVVVFLGTYVVSTANTRASSLQDRYLGEESRLVSWPTHINKTLQRGGSSSKGNELRP